MKQTPRPKIHKEFESGSEHSSQWSVAELHILKVALVAVVWSAAGGLTRAGTRAAVILAAKQPLEEAGSALGLSCMRGLHAWWEHARWQCSLKVWITSFTEHAAHHPLSGRFSQ
jgi:hypothetical protein